MHSLTEQQLLSEAQKFNLPALEAIYNRYSPGIYRYAMRLLGDTTQAEECVSETFSRFLQSLRVGQGPADHLQAYLYRIAHNWITDYYRRQPSAPVVLDENFSDETSASTEEGCEHRLEKEKVRLALLTLTPEQRTVILLRFMEGWRDEEVAAVLKKNAGSIRALQYRALRSLRTILILQEREDENEITDG